MNTSDEDSIRRGSFPYGKNRSHYPEDTAIRQLTTGSENRYPPASHPARRALFSAEVKADSIQLRPGGTFYRLQSWVRPHVMAGAKP